MLFDITLCIILCGQINDIGHEVKMMKTVFMSVLSILFSIFLFSWVSGEKKKKEKKKSMCIYVIYIHTYLIEMKIKVALCRDQCLTTTLTQITISVPRDLQLKNIALKDLFGFAFLLNKISAGDTQPSWAPSSGTLLFCL